MSSRPTASTSSPSAFEQQRAALISEIAVSLEQVLQNLNKLNRSIESVIDVGKEFGAVEALWSQFEGVIAKDDNEAKEDTEEEGASGEEAE